MSAKLEKMRDEYFRSPEIQAQISSSSHYFAYCTGFNAADAHYRPIIEELVKALEFYANDDSHEVIMEWIALPIGQIKDITSKYKEDAGKTARQALESVRGKL